MTLRKGEIIGARLRRQWPHHVALPADKVRGLTNSETVRGFADTLTVAPLTYSIRRADDDFVVFCFARQEDAAAFRERFGERAPARNTAMVAASPPKPPRVGAEQRRVLALLAGSRDGVKAELLILGHCVSRRVLAGLVRAGLAAAKREVVMAGGKAIEVVRVRITAAGRRAIGSE